MTTAELEHYYLDVRSLTLPPGLPRDTSYMLAIAVYDWQSGERLTVEEADLLSVTPIHLPAQP